jgi:predicted nucleotidyltransferase
MTRWVPEWLGKSYSKLWQTFGPREFSLDQAEEALSVERSYLLNIMSRLARQGYAARVQRGQYRVWSPEYIAASVAGYIQFGRLERDTHGSALKSIVSDLLQHFGDRLVSVVVFGSVARGNHTNESDIDVLVIVRHWKKRVMARVEELTAATEETSRLLIYLWVSEGAYSPIQWYPLDMEDAGALRPLYLDMTIDAVVVYDRNRFFTDVLERLRLLLHQTGTARVALPDGGHVWEMPSGKTLSEVLTA